MQHVFSYIKPVKIYIMHGLCYHVTHRYAVVNDVHMVIFVSVSRGTKNSFYAWFMQITTYIYACVYRLTRITQDSWLSSAWLTQARVHWADRDLAGVLARASPTNGSPGLPLPHPYIYILHLGAFNIENAPRPNLRARSEPTVPLRPSSSLPHVFVAPTRSRQNLFTFPPTPLFLHERLNLFT
jgi:hypothetical protein